MTITDTTIPTGTRHAFWIDESRRPGPRGHIPSVVFEGVSGHYPMVGQGEHAQPWYWGDTDTAKRLAAEANAALGLTPEDVSDIILSSMFAENIEAASREAAQARYDGRDDTTAAPEQTPLGALLRSIFETGNPS